MPSSPPAPIFERHNGELRPHCADQLAGAPRDERVLVRCNDHETNRIFQVDHEQPAMTLIVLIGESNCLEMEIVGDSARIMLGVSAGHKVEVCW